MTGLIVLGVVFSAFTVLALWLDHIAFDPWAHLYGTDLFAPWADRDPGDLDGGDL